MIKKVFFLLLSALPLCASMVEAQTDPVIMKVGGQSVSRSEFELCYNRDKESADDRSGMTVEKYLPSFIGFRLQVAEALAQKLDTLSAFKAEANGTEGNFIAPAMADDADLEAEARRTYEDIKANVGQRGVLRLAHILLYVRQDAPNAVYEATRRRADSICSAIKNGADFAQMARRFSADKTSAQRGGVLTDVQPNQLLKETEDVAYSLKVGEVSRPIATTQGFEVIKLLEKKPLEPYSAMRKDIIEALQKRKIREQITEERVAETQNAGNNVTANAAKADGTTVPFVKLSPAEELEDRLYGEEMLANAAQERYLDGKRPYPEAALKAFFKKNKKRYYWDEPRFKGIIIYAKKAEDIDKVKAFLKTQPYEKWEETIEKTFNSGDEPQVKYEQGLFVKGDNPYIDSCLGADKVAGQHDNEYPYTGVYGKKLKKKAVTYDEVNRWVQNDYEDELVSQWQKELSKKFPVEVFNDVLQTVNKHNK